MAGYDSGELFWDTAEATARRWVLLLDGPPGVARRRLDPRIPPHPKPPAPANCESSSGERSTRTPATGP